MSLAGVRERTGCMIFVIHEQNPQKRLIDKAVDILRQGGVIIFPTDTVYAYGAISATSAR